MNSTETFCDVLLVDDDDNALEMLLLEMKASDLVAHACRNGNEALDFLEKQIPGAILLDVQMPGMDGFETCRKIREVNENVPVIFMTGLGETEDIVRGFEVGANDYVTKPLSLPVVMARLQAHTRTARLVRVTREAINASSSAMLAVDESGMLLWCNSSASQLIKGLHPEVELFEASTLPMEFDGLLITGKKDGDLVIELPGGGVAARCITGADNEIKVFTLSRLSVSSVEPVRAESQLTDRESEVLLWVARGKTNRDIAEILGMSPRTVNKHLEHIFEKLGVETRTAAAAAGARALVLKGA